MKINFNILNQEIDLTDVLNSESKIWWFNNCSPKIPIEIKSEDLTKEQKISLIKLAMFEGWLDTENLANLPQKYFHIN